MTGIYKAVSLNESLSEAEVRLLCEERWEFIVKLFADRDALVRYVRTPKELVDRQAEDDGLWFVATTAPEEYLQNALRLLHARIEEYQALSQELKEAINAK